MQKNFFSRKISIVITLAFIAAIGLACFYSFAITYALIFLYCGFKCWNFANQAIIRHKPTFSLFILFSVFLFCVQNHSVYQRELEKNGCHIVSGLVTKKYTSKGSRGATNYHTTVEYEPRGGGLKTKDIGNKEEFDKTTVNRYIIMAEPYSKPGRFVVLEYNPSEKLVERMRHGIYAKGNLENLDMVYDNSKVRADFEDFDKPGFFDFYKRHSKLTIFILALLVFLIVFVGDKVSIFSPFIGVASITLFSIATHRGLMDIAMSCFFINFSLLTREVFFKNIRIKNEIKRNGGYVTVGHCEISGSGKHQYTEVVFKDAMGHKCRENITKFYEGNIIIAHSLYNDIDVVCLKDKPTNDLLKKFAKGMFIGPCSSIDIYNARPDNQLQIIYRSLYTQKVKDSL